MQAFLRQYGLLTLLLIIVLGLVLFALFRTEQSNEQVSVTEVGEMTPAIVSDDTGEDEIGEVQVNVSAELPNQTFDLAQIPQITDDAISPALNPRTFVGKKPALPEFETYVVQRGDTPVRIADRFGIQPETILGGNPSLNENAGVLQVDQELLILPIDGVLHDVQPGETLESVARLYSVSADDIIGYEANNLEFPFRLFADTKIIVPGAVREVFKWDPPTISNTGTFGGPTPLIVGTGTFVRPVSGGRLSQEYWYAHQAIDLAIVEGSAIFSSDTGTVTYAAWSPYCYGNLIVVNHGNGFETFYAHLSGINVVPGQIVYQGNIIGYSGNTGCSSGPHLHFEIRINGNRDDPTWYLP